MDAFRASPPKYVWLAAASSLGLFALLRLAWIDARIVAPLTAAQAVLASTWFGRPAGPLVVTQACSGVEAIALCLAAIAAYPVAWRSRLTGAAGGIALILALNIVRIGTLGLVARSPWFSALHLYIWPAVLTLAIAFYVFTWMRMAEGSSRAADVARVTPPSRRFIILAVLFLVVFVATAPLYLGSALILALAAYVASGAAGVLALVGVPARAAANVLWIGGGGFLVTQECLATPLIPLYLAGVTAYAPTWRHATAGVLAAAPIFVVLGIARLLLVALPPAVASPLFWVHSFYQVLAAVLVVCAVAFWRHRDTAGRRGFAGVGIGILSGAISAVIAAPLLGVLHVLPDNDPQGALAFLPAFQVGLYAALCVAAARTPQWRRITLGAVGIWVCVFMTLALLRALSIHAGLAPHVRDIRAWAILAPSILAAIVLTDARARR